MRLRRRGGRRRMEDPNLCFAVVLALLVAVVWWRTRAGAERERSGR